MKVDVFSQIVKLKYLSLKWDLNSYLVSFNKLRASADRHLVVDNYFLSTTKCYWQLKKRFVWDELSTTER